MIFDDYPGSDFLFCWPFRICLPFHLDLLQLARWITLLKDGADFVELELVAGEEVVQWTGADPIELFNYVTEYCLSYSLSFSYVKPKRNNSLLFFDKYERFSCFSGDVTILKSMYPYSREIIWEYFNLIQKEDDDCQLLDIFRVVNSV